MLLLLWQFQDPYDPRPVKSTRPIPISPHSSVLGFRSLVVLLGLPAGLELIHFYLAESPILFVEEAIVQTCVLLRATGTEYALVPVVGFVVVCWLGDWHISCWRGVRHGEINWQAIINGKVCCGDVDFLVKVQLRV